MNEKPSPKDVLQDYFDELLAGENPLSKPAPTFADPDLEKQQKLEKLLQNARQQVMSVTAPEVTVMPSVVTSTVPHVIDTAEIQEWDIEPSTQAIEPGVQTKTAQPDIGDVKAEGLIAEVAPTAELAGSVDESNYNHNENYNELALDQDLLTWAENGLPQWAQDRFDVLLFQVSGLTLAVPLIALGQIVPLTDELTPLFGQADWFMGLLPTAIGKIRTINTAKFVMPERYDENFLKTAKYVISINGVPWGLAVDSVNQPITLQPDDVKWRGERTKRPWLAGTVKAHMCALLDIPMIGQLLTEADRNSPKSRRSVKAQT